MTRIADFTTGTYSGITPTCSRSTSGYAAKLDGSLTAFAVDALRRTNKGLLVEPAGTNYLSYSRDLAGSGYTVYQDGSATATRSANQGVAPDGSMTAALITLTRTVDSNTIVNASSVMGTGPVTSGLWIKAYAAGDSGKHLNLAWQDNANHNDALATLTADWQRAIWPTRTPAAGSSIFPFIGLLDPGFGSPSNNDLGSTSFYAWNGQVESGPSASSDILTSVSSTSRSADQVSFVVPSGVTQLLYTFDDGSTQNVAVTPGATYTIPTTLNRPYIATIDSNASSSTNGNASGSIASSNSASPQGTPMASAAVAVAIAAVAAAVLAATASGGASPTAAPAPIAVGPMAASAGGGAAGYGQFASTAASAPIGTTSATATASGAIAPCGATAPSSSASGGSDATGGLGSGTASPPTATTAAGAGAAGPTATAATSAPSGSAQGGTSGAAYGAFLTVSAYPPGAQGGGSSNVAGSLAAGAVTPLGGLASAGASGSGPIASSGANAPAAAGAAGAGAIGNCASLTTAPPSATAQVTSPGVAAGSPPAVAASAPQASAGGSSSALGAVALSAAQPAVGTAGGSSSCAASIAAGVATPMMATTTASGGAVGSAATPVATAALGTASGASVASATGAFASVTATPAIGSFGANSTAWGSISPCTATPPAASCLGTAIGAYPFLVSSDWARVASPRSFTVVAKLRIFAVTIGGNRMGFPVKYAGEVRNASVDFGTALAPSEQLTGQPSVLMNPGDIAISNIVLAGSVVEFTLAGGSRAGGIFQTVSVTCSTTGGEVVGENIGIQVL